MIPDSQILVQTRNFALRARGFFEISSSEAVIGRFVTISIGGGINFWCANWGLRSLDGLASSRNRLLTILSSSEWKLITHSFPPDFKAVIAWLSTISRLSNSWLTAIRRA